MKLLTNELKRKLPDFTVERGEAVAVVKFFAPWSSWTWYAAEYDPASRTFWGLVNGFEKEYGCFSLDELEQVPGPFGLRIERDKFFRPTPLKDLE
ncbi:DUF2958 domain-containing protein [Streptomyces sp. NBC_00988]|uniref:DUF2958 domain-containing protein n=1 Tax=Streptomyces sp. NBC_00988 TaxID=2903704 RepID=UPI00386A7197|nr:DUF2958 domain-containing protein [Streptomyces sp. NBC_00988]